MCRSAIDLHTISLKMSFELTTVLACCEAPRSSRCAARNPRRNGAGFGGAGGPHPPVNKTAFTLLGASCALSLCSGSVLVRAYRTEVDRIFRPSADTRRRVL